MMKLKPLVKMMAVLSIATMPAMTNLHASDLSIYKGNTTGRTSILLMLDTSGSMGISSLVLPRNNQYGSPGDVDSSLCDRVQVSEHHSNRSYTSNIYQWAYNLRDPVTDKTAIRKTVTIGGTEIPYYVRGCTQNGVTQYDRLSRLKDAIIPLLASNDLSNDVLMGLGQFSSKTELTIGTATNRLTDGHSGRILVPNAALSSAQRIKIAQGIAAIKSLDTTTDEDGTANADLKLSSNNYPNVTKASSGTPTVHAYAEAAAYMMGTVTGTGGTNSGRVDTIYDGYMVMQNGDQQVYFICVEVGTTTTEALGATVKQCVNNWPGHDEGNRTVGTSTVSGGIYKPNGTGGWTRFNSQTTFKNEVGAMNSGWETFTKLPEGWRYGGWMKVNNEPMDIEPIVGTVWTGYAGGTIGIVSYRTNPFSIKSEWLPKSVPTYGFTNCPSGFNVMSGWAPLCVRSGTFWRDATPAEVTARACSSPAIGEDPIANARNTNGDPHTERYNFQQAGLRYQHSDKRCYQDRHAVNRPWGQTGTTTVQELTPIDNNGGFAYSASDTKNSAGTAYQAGGSTGSCDGNGIYFLTDGAPNSTKDSMARTIMNTTLQSATYQFTAKPTGTGILTSPTLNSGLFAGETGGWEYIGEYAKKLRNRTTTSNTQKNPKNMNIKTAVVGFGSSFAGIPKNSDGTYNCEAVRTTNLDAYNACKWGGAEYGDGGFYYAENSEDIKNSIINFVNNVAVSFTPSSLGTISVPRDPLDQTRVMATGYFPMIMPSEDTTLRNWVGNLKKFKVVGGTLKDAGNRTLYITENNKQLINDSARDLWSLSTEDTGHSWVNSGGAWNKIPVPSTLNITGEPSKLDSERIVYTMDGTAFKRVTKANLATDYTGTTPSALDVTNINIAQRYALLNYLGYQTVFPPATDATLTTAQVEALTVPANPYRYLGGVVHSTPLVVTKTATVNESSNAISNREEYVVYGSMDGGLHIVDAATGKEESVFIPKETLTNQYDTLAKQDSKGLTGLTGMVYGVDAPWAADNTFKVTSTTSGTTTTTKYLANRMNIYGGLRMGGKALYGLNISSPTSPSLLFHINDSTAGFGRLAQIWSKPTIATIRVKGERKRVLIFGGGYDANVYEKPAASFIEPTTATQGNAIYIVDAETGALIWMTSSVTTGVSDAHKKIESSEVLYSVVGQPAVRDYDADGLTDIIYFADMGGQIFRIDLNNAAQISKTTDVNVGVRVQRIANLRDGTGANTFVPRFYDRLTTGVFDDSSGRFVFVTVGSGNRSFPLEGSVQNNKIYGIIDRDAAKNGIEKTTYTEGFQAVATTSNIANRGKLGKRITGGTLVSDMDIYWNVNGTKGDIGTDNITAGIRANTLRGWSFSLNSVADETSQKFSKSFEESQLISGDIYANVYDPKATLNGVVNACGGGIQGISTTHRICAPFGDCAAYVKTDYQGIVSPILGTPNEESRTLGVVGPISETKEKCIGKCEPDVIAETEKDLPEYNRSRLIKPTRWFEW